MNIRSYLAELKERGVRKTLAIYISTGLTTIGIVKLITDTYGLSPAIFSVTVTLFFCGLGSAFIHAWYHGKDAPKRMRKREIVLHTMMLVLALVISFKFSTGTRKLLLPLDAKTIAVLPFENWSGVKEDEYFTDGIMEDILTQLCKISDLHVISRTSMMAYKGTRKKTKEIAGELGAGSILEGSVRRVGSRVRITGQLVNANTDQHIWSEQYDREMKDIFAIQTEVATRIASQLNATLLPAEHERIRKEPTRNLDAYTLYLRARDYIERHNNEDNERAIVLLQKAIGLDPAYALAYALLSQAYSARYYPYGQPVAWADSGIALGLKAAALDRNAAEAYFSTGLAYEHKEELSLALRYQRQAIDLNPNFYPAVSAIGWVSFELGKVDEALSWMRKGALLAPDNAAQLVNVGAMLLQLDEDSVAAQWLRKAGRLQNDFSSPQWYLTYMYLERGMVRQAREEVTKALATLPDDVSLLSAAGDVETIGGNLQAGLEFYEKSFRRSSLETGFGTQYAFLLKKSGKEGEANAILDSTLNVLRKASVERNEGFFTPLAIANVYAVKGDIKQALTWLTTAVNRGYREYRWMQLDPLLENLRREKEFTRLVEDVRNRVGSMRDRAKEQGLLGTPPSETSQK